MTKQILVTIIGICMLSAILFYLVKLELSSNKHFTKVCLDGHLYHKHYRGIALIINDFGAPVECEGGCKPMVQNMTRFDDLIDAIERKDAELTADAINGIVEDYYDDETNDSAEFKTNISEYLGDHHAW